MPGNVWTMEWVRRMRSVRCMQDTDIQGAGQGRGLFCRPVGESTLRSCFHVLFLVMYAYFVSVGFSIKVLGGGARFLVLVSSCFLFRMFLFSYSVIFLLRVRSKYVFLPYIVFVSFFRCRFRHLDNRTLPCPLLFCCFVLVPGVRYPFFFIFLLHSIFLVSCRFDLCFPWRFSVVFSMQVQVDTWGTARSLVLVPVFRFLLFCYFIICFFVFLMSYRMLLFSCFQVYFYVSPTRVAVAMSM